MHKILRAILAMFVFVTPLPSIGQSTIEKARRDEISIVPDDDPEMAKAFRKAQATFDNFLTIARSAPAHIKSVAVKVAVSDATETEYFWITPFTEDGGNFKGRINNTPRLVKNVKLNQEIHFVRPRIVDWMYVDVSKKRMFGNFTACALLKHEPPSEAEKFKKQFGLECDL